MSLSIDPSVSKSSLVLALGVRHTQTRVYHFTCYLPPYFSSFTLVKSDNPISNCHVNLCPTRSWYIRLVICELFNIFFNKTHLVVGSLDCEISELYQSQQNLTWVSSTNERFGWDPMKGFHESRSPQLLGLLSYEVFVNIFPSKLFIFIWTTMNYFFIVKVVVASSQQAKCSISLLNDVTVNTMSKWSCLGNYAMSQWVGDIVMDNKWSRHQQPGSFTQDPVKPESFTSGLDGRKTWIFNLKIWV